MNNGSKNSGFTLLELLFVIVIAGIISTIIFLSLFKLNSSQALEKSADLVASVLNEAKALTLSSKGDTQYGVHFEPTQVVLFMGGAYSPSDGANVVSTLHSLTGIQNINLNGGGSDVIFKRLTGNTDQHGSVEVFLLASTTVSRTITISATGVVELD